MVGIKENIANKSNYGGKRSTSDIKYIVVHYTGNDGDSDESNAKYFKNNIVKASAHYFVDDDSITRSVPDNYIAYSVGGDRYSNYKTTGGATYYKKCTNTNSISIELCDSYKNGKVYPTDKTIKNALDLVETLMKKYNIHKTNVIRHFDVTGKSCPNYWCGTDSKNKLWKTEFYNKINTTNTTTTTKKYTRTQFIKDIQKVLGVKVDGVAGPITLGKTVTVSVDVNRTHGVVRPIQKYLNSLGYECGSVDGIAGAQFKKGVVKYQKAKGCAADGIITAKQKTWKKLLGID